MAITLDQLEGVSVDDLKKSLIEYADALDVSNLKITELTEELNSVKVDLEKTKEFTEEQKALIIKADKDNTKLSRSQAKKIETLETTINTLKEAESKTASITKENLKVIKDLETKIQKYDDIKTTVNMIPKTRIHTYLIKGYDNRSGLSIHGGPLYDKAMVIVKMDENKLSWELKCPDLQYNINRSIELNDTQIDYFKTETEIKNNTFFVVIKEFLQIPTHIENGFNKESLLIKGN